MSKTTYVAITPDGLVGTRASATMIYTHAVAVMNTAGALGDRWGILSWHTSEAYADKAARGKYVLKSFPQIRVVPVAGLALTGKALTAKLAEIRAAVSA